MMLAVSLAGCGGKQPPPDLQAEVTRFLDDIPTVVADPARAAKVRTAYEKLGHVLVQSASERRELAARWNELYRRYDTPRETLEDLLSEHRALSERVRLTAIEAREEVRTHTTASEWKALAESRKTLGKLFIESSR
jgi:hypothetical protein